MTREAQSNALLHENGWMSGKAALFKAAALRRDSGADAAFFASEGYIRFEHPLTHPSSAGEAARHSQSPVSCVCSLLREQKLRFSA